MDKATDFNYKKTIEGYLNIDDWRVKENSTVSYSLGGLILSNSGAMTANYWLNEIYPKEIADLHKNCDIHIHDLSMLSGYCAGWSLKQLIKEGLTGISGRVAAAPASHLSTLCNQMVNFLGIMQNEWAGAQAFSSFDTYLAPFVKVDNLSYKEVKQCIQSFVYGVNIPSRWGTQAPFTNITLDWVVPNDMAELNCIVGGKEVNFCYKDCKAEMDMINKAFIEIMIEGDANGRGFQYPIPTYSITKNFDWSETENNKLLFTMTAKYGTPYFSNYINSDMEPSDVRSMCPLHGKTNILWYSEDRQRFYLSPIKQICDNEVKNLKVLSNGKLVPAKINKFNISANYKITLSNGESIITTANHLNLTLDKGYVQTKDLKVGDYLPYSLTPTNLFKENLNYDYGKFVGMYLGDGCREDTNKECGIDYCLNDSTKLDLVEYIKEYTPKLFGSHYSIYEDKETHSTIITIRSKFLKGLIDEFVEGSDALTKSLSMKAIAQSLEFRKGILDGYMLTDGARNNTKNNIYTSSLAMVDSIKALAGTLGIPTKVMKYEEDENKVIIKGVEYNSSGANYCIEFYDNIKRDNYGDKYIKKDNYLWFSISNIEILKPGKGAHGGASNNSYCVEILSEDEPIFMLGNGLYTHNCRLRLDLRELRKKSGGFFGSGESTGSVGVVTINMPRLGYLSENEEDFFKRLDYIMDLSAKSLKIKRDTITQLLEKGLYPYTKAYLGTFKNHFSTIGLVGMNECCLNARWLKKSIDNSECLEFSKKVLNHMRTRLSDYQEQYGDLYNLEATPAESTTYRLAKHDKEKYPNIITAGDKGSSPYYTNSSHLPVSYTEDIFSALDIQDQLQTLYTSGTVFHAFLGEKLPNWKSCMNLVRKIAENYKLPYYTMSPTYSVCPDHGYIVGEHFTCPKCGAKTEVYSRITGYYRPVQNWNDGKTQEFKDRKTYNIKESKLESKLEIKNENNCKSNLEEGVYLFGTKTCPNCKMAKILLNKHEVEYTWIDAEEKSNLAIENNIKSVPVLIIINEGMEFRYTNASEIKKFLENRD